MSSSFLSRGIEKLNLTEPCKQTHRALQSLWKYYEPATNLPQNGIYFFYEEGEFCSHTGKARIVRVGTHGERATLRKRLRQHYRLNREGSVFRKHLGTALLKKKGFLDDQISEWRKGRKSKRWNDFKDTEDEICQLLRSKFFFRVIAVDSANERKILEEKLIASLAVCSECKPSTGWLGRFAWSKKIRKSGLWNSNYVDSENKMDAEDLERLRQLVRQT